MKVFDLHCDTITTAMNKSFDMTNKSLDVSIDNHDDDDYIQCFAIFCPDTIRGVDAYDYYNIAKNFFSKQCEKYSNDIIFCQNISSSNFYSKNSSVKAILTIEGGAVINGCLDNLDRFYNDGVRMLTLTWNGENELGCGSSNQNFKLKPFGIDCIKRMEKLGITIDVSHLSDNGFWDVADNVSVPFVASHSNLRKICNHNRNLTDDEFKEIVNRKGLVGINFYESFLNDSPNLASVHDIYLNIMAMLELGGEHVIALGSDYDGCDVVKGLSKHTDLLYLYNYLLEKDIPQKIVDDIFWNNAYNYFCRNSK